MTVYRNLVDSAQAIVLAVRKIEVDCEMPSNRVSLSISLFFLVLFGGPVVLGCAPDYPLLFQLFYFNVPSLFPTLLLPFRAYKAARLDNLPISAISSILVSMPYTHYFLSNAFPRTR